MFVRSYIAPVLAVFMLLPVSDAVGTTVLQISLEQMTMSSTVIAHGTVVSSKPVAVNGNERHIKTHVDIAVSTLLKGPRGMRTIQLKLPGGRLGKWAMSIPGMPTFIKGEEVLLFLEKTKTNWALTGMSQGKYVVTKEADGRKVVQRNMHGVHFVTRDKNGKLHRAHPRQVKSKQSLNSIIAEIRQTLRKPQTTKQ